MLREYLPTLMVIGLAVVVFMHWLESKYWAPDLSSLEDTGGLIYTSAVSEQQIFRVVTLGSLLAVVYLITHGRSHTGESYGTNVLVVGALLLPLVIVAMGQRIFARITGSTLYADSHSHDKTEYFSSTVIIAAMVALFYYLVCQKAGVDSKAKMSGILFVGFLTLVLRLVSEWSVNVEDVNGNGDYKLHRVCSLINAVIVVLLISMAVFYSYTDGSAKVAPETGTTTTGTGKT